MTFSDNLDHFPKQNYPINIPRDTGCDVHPFCLECPLPECKYDNYEAYRDWKSNKFQKIKETMVLLESGLTTSEVALILKISTKLVSRRRNAWLLEEN